MKFKGFLVKIVLMKCESELLDLGDTISLMKMWSAE